MASLVVNTAECGLRLSKSIYTYITSIYAAIVKRFSKFKAKKNNSVIATASKNYGDIMYEENELDEEENSDRRLLLFKERDQQKEKDKSREKAIRGKSYRD